MTTLDSGPVHWPLLGVAVEATRQPPAIGGLVNGTVLWGDGAQSVRTSPATGAPLFTAASLSPAQVDAAIGAARSAFDHGPWGRATGRERARALLRVAELLDQRAEQMAALIVAETGKPIREARGEVGAAVNILEYFGGLARDVTGRTHRDVAPDRFAFTIREPAGVAGLIVPWNFPLAILCQKLPPALAAGCAAVVKPSPLTPLSALALATILAEAGLPDGVVNVVVGDAEAGARVVEAAEVDVVSFTGSTAVGRLIAERASRTRLKRVAIEAGGKTPVVVLRDADLEQAVDGVLFSAFFNQGEVCVAGSRILVDTAVEDAFVERFAERAAAIRLGDPFDEATEMGPLISDDHCVRVETMLRQSEREGARVRAGGTRLAASVGGPYLQPTVLDRVNDTNVAASEELFGPVAAVQRFDDLDTAVQSGNAARYGLAASVWTNDLDRALKAALRLRVGTVWINGSTDAYPELPLGGRRDSGFGAELGREGMEFFTDAKTVQVLPRPGGAWYSAGAVDPDSIGDGVAGRDPSTSRRGRTT